MNATEENDGFAVALRQAIADRRISLTQLAARSVEEGAPVTVATLSYWINGRRRPKRRSSLEVILTLERLLDLEPGHLVNHVQVGGESWRYKRGDESRVLPVRHELEAIREEWDLPWDDGLHRCFVRSHGFYGEDVVRTTYNLVVIAERDGISRFAVFLSARPEMVQRRRSPFVVVNGCRMGRSRIVNDRVLAQELLLPRPLKAGEPATIVFREHDRRPTEKDTRIELNSVRPADVLSVQATFPPDGAPAWVQRSRGGHDAATGEHRTVTDPPARVTADAVQCTAAQVTLGHVALDWGPQVQTGLEEPADTADV